MTVQDLEVIELFQKVTSIHQEYLIHQNAQDALTDLLHTLRQQANNASAFLYTLTSCTKTDSFHLFVETKEFPQDSNLLQELEPLLLQIDHALPTLQSKLVINQPLFSHTTQRQGYMVRPLFVEGRLVGITGVITPLPLVRSLEQHPAWNAIATIFADFKKRLHAEEIAKNNLHKSKRDEEELRIAQKIARVGTWRYETNEQKLHISEETYRILQRDLEQGPPSLEELSESIHNGEREHFFLCIQRCIDKHQPFELSQHRRISTQKEIHLVLQGIPQRDENNQCHAIFGTVQDVTERTLDLEEKRRFEERLYQSQRLESLGLLAGGIAHDVNNLLMGVFTEASLLQETVPAGTSVHNGLERILHAANQIRQLARQLLAYSGRGRFEIEAFFPDKMVQDLSTFLQRNIPSTTRLRLSLKASHATILADVSQLQQVLMNLVLNAAEAIQHAHGLIQLQSRVVGIPSLPAPSYPAPHGWWELCVEDNGSGVPEDAKKRLLEPFFTTKKQGRGLGLAIVAGIVHRLHGTIHCQDSLTQGTRFFIRLPIHPSDIPKPAAPKPPPPKFSPLPSRHILIADDEDLVRKLLERVLAHQGCRTTSTQDGLEAIELFRQDPQSFDLVLLDVSMPNCNGYDAIREIRSIRKDTPIILISGFSEGIFGGTWQDDLETQPNAFLEKPFKVPELLRLLQELLPEQNKES